jgi:choline dehydrogenase-like flavoprotein
MAVAKALLRAEVVVVGTGPGGATVARELARAGRSVLLLERGRNERHSRLYGTYLGALRYLERHGLFFTPEGVQVVIPSMVGGATGVFAGCAAPPPPWLQERYGIDIRAEVEETIQELGIAPLPPELRGTASTQLAQAAQSLGYEVYPQPKFMRPERAQRFDCGAHCLLGCRCGAKWSAAAFVAEAVEAGAQLLTQAHVERVLIPEFFSPSSSNLASLPHPEKKILQDGCAIGVEGRHQGRPFLAFAEQVILCAGGLGTPRILRASGIQEAGDQLAMDLTVIVYGRGKGRGNASEPPMSWSWEDPALEVMFSPLIDPSLLYPIIAGMTKPKRAFTWHQWRQMLGVMIKLRDSLSGELLPDGSLSKPLTPGDKERLQEAEQIARRILIEAGAAPESLFTSPMRGTHPSATVRIGTLVDTNLRTPIQGLYVCDASVFPEALGRPTVLTIIGLAKRLARQLAPRAKASGYASG